MLLSLSDLSKKHGLRARSVLHLGAHLGEEANEYEAFGIESVLWVEGNPGVCSRLRESVGGRAGHQVLEGAISDADDDEVEFHIASNSFSSSLLRMKLHREKHPDVTEVMTVRVKTVTVDTLLSRHKIDPGKFDLLVMDLQGAELKALMGMRKTLCMVRHIITEVNTEELYQGCALLPGLKCHLEARGFSLLEVNMWSDWHAWGDAFFSRR